MSWQVKVPGLALFTAGKGKHATSPVKHSGNSKANNLGRVFLWGVVGCQILTITYLYISRFFAKLHYYTRGGNITYTLGSLGLSWPWNASWLNRVAALYWLDICKIQPHIVCIHFPSLVGSFVLVFEEQFQVIGTGLNFLVWVIDCFSLIHIKKCVLYFFKFIIKYTWFLYYYLKWFCYLKGLISIYLSIFATYSMTFYYIFLSASYGLIKVAV